MPRKMVLTLSAFLLVGATVLAVGLVASDNAGVFAVDADSPCPATACASGACHGFDDVPEPDGTSEMECPEAGCASVECHAWETLVGGYRQASDASLNVWILFPVALVLALFVLVRKVR